MKIGAYAVERDYSHYVANISTTVLAVVGTASKGPVNEPTLCTSAQDLTSKFGPLNPSHLALYAGQYFLSQASRLYFVRVDSKDMTSAQFNLKGKSDKDTDIVGAITFDFIDKGSYYNKCTMDIETVVVDTEIRYNITLYSPTRAVLENIKKVRLSDLIKTASNSTEESPKYEFKSKYLAVSAVNLGPTDDSLSSLVPSTEIEATATGSDGTSSTGDYNTAVDKLAPETIDINLIAVPGVSDDAVIANTLQVAEARGDCLYIIDPPIDPDTGATLERDDVIAWHNASGDYEKDSNDKDRNRSIFNNSYGALYYDWVVIYDSVNNTEVKVPPSVVVPATIAYSDRISELWYAPAGLNRGLVRGVLGTVTKLSKNDTEALYSEGNNINAIYEDPQAGIVLWGQKTLSRADSALNRINVRRLMNYLKKVVIAACNYMTFDPNDRITWNSFRMKVDPILSGLVSKRGIYEYRIIKGETIVTNNDIDNYRMPCMIMIRPTKAAEEIPVYFTITSTGADFNEVLDANGVIDNETI